MQANASQGHVSAALVDLSSLSRLAGFWDREALVAMGGSDAGNWRRRFLTCKYRRYDWSGEPRVEKMRAPRNRASPWRVCRVVCCSKLTLTSSCAALVQFWVNSSQRLIECNPPPVINVARIDKLRGSADSEFHILSSLSTPPFNYTTQLTS
jgi:hypothetical protein